MLGQQRAGAHDRNPSICAVREVPQILERVAGASRRVAGPWQLYAQLVRVVRVPTTEISDWDGFHRGFERVLGFPSFYGQNMNAWIDCLTSADALDDGIVSGELRVGGVDDRVRGSPAGTRLGIRPVRASGSGPPGAPDRDKSGHPVS